MPLTAQEQQSGFQQLKFMNETAVVDPKTNQAVRTFSNQPSTPPVTPVSNQPSNNPQPAPAVVTSKQAREATLDNQQKLTMMEQNLVPQEKPKEKTANEKQTDDQMAAVDAETSSYIGLLDQRRAQLDAASNAMIESIKQSFERRRKETETVNKAAQAGLTTAGYRSGRTRYATEIQQGILSTEEREGIQRIADLDSQEMQLVQQAREANDEKSFALLNERMTALSNARKEKNQLIADLHRTTMEQERLSLEKARAFREEESAALQREEFGQRLREYEDKKFESNRDFITQNNITQPLYELGNLIIDSATGAPVFQNIGGELQDFAGNAFEKDEDFFQAAGIQSWDQIQKLQRPRFNKDNIFGSAEAGYFTIDPQSGGVTQLTEPSMDQEFNKLLSPDEAAKLGVPYGTSRGQAAGMGIQPQTQQQIIDPKERSGLELNYKKNFDQVTKEATGAIRNVNGINTAYNQAVSDLKAGKDINSSSQAIITEFNKILDPTSVVRESEYARTPEGQSLLSQIEGKYIQLKQGGTGLTADNLKSVVDLANQLSLGYQQYQLEQALIVSQAADAYGLNKSLILPSSVLKQLEEIQGKKQEQTTFTPPTQTAGPLPNTPQIQALKKQIPGITDEEIKAALSFNQVGNTSASSLKNRNLSYGVELPNIKVQIGAGAAVKNNNPGNLRDSDGSWMKFSTPEEGFKALTGYLERAKTGDHSRYNGKQTLYEFFAVYAPSADNNNPKKYAEAVANKLGVSPTTKIGSINTFAFAKEIARHESSTKVIA